MNNEDFVINPKTSALVLIDLEKRILTFPAAPHSHATVTARSASMAAAFRKLGSTVVLVRVSFKADGLDRVRQPTDAAFPSSSVSGPEDFIDELDQQESDLVVTKRQWGAFYGTDLELQLRRRGIDTIVLGGITTNFGVESTARDAFERNFALIFAEDAMATVSAEAHAFALSTIFPRLGRIRSTRQILDALVGGE